jgi:hypothetical protein
VRRRCRFGAYLMTITDTNSSGAVESTNTTTFNTYEMLPDLHTNRHRRANRVAKRP